MVKIDFEREYEGMVFRDAIVLPADHSLTEAEIKQIQDQRFAAWINAIKPSDEEMEN